MSKLILYLLTISLISGKVHNCGEWSDWMDFETLTEEMTSNYQIILDENQSQDICHNFSLEPYIKQEEMGKGFKMSVVKTAGLASCLGLTFAIGAIIIYSKTSKEMKLEE